MIEMLLISSRRACCISATIASVLAVDVYAGEVVFLTENVGESGNITISIADTKLEFLERRLVHTVLNDGNHVAVVHGPGGKVLEEIPFTLSNSQNAEVRLRIDSGDLTHTVDKYADQEEPPVAGGVAGVVLDESGEPVDNAQVSFTSASVSAVTDAEGRFAIQIPRGIHGVSVTHSQRGTANINELPVAAGETSSITVELKQEDSGISEELVVFGVMPGLPETAMDMERDSAAVVDAISTAELARFGDSTAIGAVQRVTGVSIIDGQFAVVRGLAGRYIASTLDGGLLPSTDFLRRDVALDLFPSSILGEIRIAKSYSPELPGDATGGVVGMRARGLPEEQVGEISLSIGGNTAVLADDIITYDGGGRDYTGFDDNGRELPETINRATDFGRNDLPNQCPPPPLNIPGCVGPTVLAEYGKSLSNNYDVQYREAHPDIGFDLAYGDQLEAGFGSFGYYGAIAYAHEWDVRRDAQEQVYAREGTNGFDLSEQNDYARSVRQIDVSAYLLLGTESDGGTQFTSKSILLRNTTDLTRQSSRRDLTESKLFEETLLQWTERQMAAQKFSLQHFLGSSEAHSMNWHVGVAQTTRDEPDRREYVYENGNLTPSRIFRRYTELTEDALDFGVDYVWSMEVARNLASELKLGVYGAQKDRELALARFGFVIDNSIDRQASVEAIMIPENFDQGAVRLRSQGQPTDYSDASDDVAAFYASTVTELGEEFSLLAGARFEKGEQEIRYPLAGESDSIDPLENEEWLPALMLTWRPTDAWQFRAGASRTLSRPGLVERSYSQFFDPDTDEKIVGNPNLLLSIIDNYDLRAEYYFSEDENISVALFAKEIDKPIERTVPAGVREGYTFRNSEAAEILGIEIDFKKIVVDGDGWEGFIAGNASWVDSEVTLDEQTAQLEGVQGRPRNTRQLQGQSEHLANLQVGLDNVTHGHSVTLMANYFDDRIYRVDNASRGDEIEKGRTLIDFVYQWEATDDVTAKLKINNVLNEKIVFESAGEREISREEYEIGTEFSIGIGLKF